MFAADSSRNLTLLFIFLFFYSPSAVSSEEVFEGRSEILKGLKLAYELKFDEAKEFFTDFSKMHPQSPAGMFYQAAMESGIIESDRRWLRVARLYGSSDPPARAVKKRSLILKEMRKTIERCEELLKENKRNFEALFYKAGAYSFSARIDMYNGNYISGFRNGKKGARFFDELLAAFPEEGDAMLGPGVYKYFVGRLSGPMRFLVGLLGLSGSKEEGLALLRKAGEKGSLSYIEAAKMLAMIYGRFEHDYREALKWADVLEREVPMSPMAGAYRIFNYNRMGDKDNEEKAIIDLMEIMEKAPDVIRLDWMSLLTFSLGVIKERRGKGTEAESLFDKALLMEGADPWLIAEIESRRDPHTELNEGQWGYVRMGRSILDFELD